MYGQVLTIGRTQDNLTGIFKNIYHKYSIPVILLKHIFELTEEILCAHC